MARMALTLWSTQTPGNALRERDTIVMNNKKKVENKAIVIELFDTILYKCTIYHILYVMHIAHMHMHTAL